MQLETNAAIRTPNRPAVQRVDSGPTPDAPHWIEGFRADRWRLAITLALDVLTAAAVVALAQWWSPDGLESRELVPLTWVFVPFVVVVLSTRSLYRRKLNFHFLDDLEPVETAIAVAALATLTVMMLAVPPLQDGEVVHTYVRPGDLVLRVWAGATILMPTVRLGRSMLNRYLRRKFRIAAPALIVGSGPVANQIIARMRQVPEYGLRAVGVLDDTRPADAGSFDVPYLGTTDDLESAARATHAEELIVAQTSVPDDQLAHTALMAHNLGMRVRVVPRLMDAVNASARIEHLGGVPLMVLFHVDPKGWQFAVKHAFDRTAAGVGLLLISPLFLGLALLVKISSPGPVFYRQSRIGRDGKVFDCLKFRSMSPADPANAGFAPEEGSAPGGVEGDDRRTRIGKIMRQTSMDELPQLLNVLRGDMSLVGPRPERPAYVELFEMRVRRYGDRHRVKAGITGWSQVHGLRGQTSIADRAEYDNYYIENWSLHLDFKILALTVLAVLRRAED